MASQEDQARQLLVQQAQQRQMQLMAARQHQQQQQQRGQSGTGPNQMAAQQMSRAAPHATGANIPSSAPVGLPMATPHDDIPITHPSDLDLFTSRAATTHPDLAAFQTACRDGPPSAVEPFITNPPRTPAFLHQGLVAALSAGNPATAALLLSRGAPITRQTPQHILSAPGAPSGLVIQLFDLLLRRGPWTPNSPGFYGATLLPQTVTDDALLSWFLAHGADPNLGPQPDHRDRYGAPDPTSCAALEAASARGSAASVRRLLDAGALIANGAPLYVAAGACPPGANPHAAPVAPGREFDAGRIPVMALLVERGADVNGKLESRHMTAQYPIVNAVMAGAVERVRWLLSRGADPGLRGAFGSAVEYAGRVGSEEMKVVLGIKAEETV